MKNSENWKESKFVYRGGVLQASHDKNEVGVSSRLVVKNIARLYGKYLPKYAKGKLLDLGCGKVPLYKAYKQYITENICVDWNKSLHHNSHVDFEVDLTKELSFEDHSFDTVLLSDVLEHIPNPENLWDEVHRILKPKGVMLLNVPFYYCLHEAPYDFYRYTEYALKRFAKNFDFKIVKLISIGGSPEITADLFGKHIRHLPFIGDYFADLGQKVIPPFLKALMGKKRYKKSVENFPLGYFMIAQKK